MVYNHSQKKKDIFSLVRKILLCYKKINDNRNIDIAFQDFFLLFSLKQNHVIYYYYYLYFFFSIHY